VLPEAAVMNWVSVMEVIPLLETMNLIIEVVKQNFC
jgi:hypothetical protein